MGIGDKSIILLLLLLLNFSLIDLFNCLGGMSLDLSSGVRDRAIFHVDNVSLIPLCSPCYFVSVALSVF